MTPLIVATVVFACVMGGGLIGILVQGRLPGHHLSADSKEVVKLSMGLTATMSALVLGLVTASSKATYDSESNEVKRIASDALALDRLMSNYGPEAAPIRRALRDAVEFRLEKTWPEDESQHVRLDTLDTAARAERIDQQISALVPATDTQRWIQTQGLTICSDWLQARWALFEATGIAMPAPFLVVLVFWLTTLFASFGLFAPRNRTVLVALLLGALSVASAIFLILEMSTPFEGLMRVSDAPLRYALEHVGP